MPGFDEKSAKRISDAVRRVEGMPLGSLPEPKAPRIIVPSKFAVTSSTITARSGTTLGKGTAILQLLSVASGVATYASMGQSVTVYNGAGASIASGRLVQLKVVDGVYVIDVDFCP